MDLVGDCRINADRDAVWAALTDPEVLRHCVPGCSEMRGTLDDGFDAVVMQKVGPVKATFRGRVTLKDREAPRSLTIRGEGQGGKVGSANGEADVVLSIEPHATRVDYRVRAELGGKLAWLSQRIVDGFARRMIEHFFARLQAVVETRQVTPAPHDARD